MRRITIVIVLVLLSEAAASTAQDKKFRITMLDGAVISDVALEDLRGTNGHLLIVAIDTTNQVIVVDSISEIRLVKDVTFWDGAKVGWEVGTVAGVIDGAIYAKGPGENPNSDLHFFDDQWVYRPIVAFARGIYCGIIGSLFGGIVGAMIGTDEVYDLSQLPLAGKITVIQKILSVK